MSRNPSRRPRSSRTAYTLIELVLVLTILSLVSLAGLSRLHRWLDQVATHDAVRAMASTISRARDDAIALHTLVTVRVDTVAVTLKVRANGAQTALVPIGFTHGVSISTTRDSLVFDARGLGYGAANLTIVARRGSSVDTLVVSRLGRVRF
jgi:prepilin-type N-terminal cleavage/methylation domain-containing protein